MSTPALPPRIDPTLSTAAGRRKLLGRHVDEALSLTRGYEVSVVYGSWGSGIKDDARRAPAGQITIALNRESRVVAVR